MISSLCSLCRILMLRSSTRPRLRGLTTRINLAHTAVAQGSKLLLFPPFHHFTRFEYCSSASISERLIDNASHLFSAVSSSSGSFLTYEFEGKCTARVSSDTNVDIDYNWLLGNGVQLFGPVGPNQAPYEVQIDGGEVRRFSASKATYTPQMLLYHADQLSSGKHVLKLVYRPTEVNQIFAIDYANVLSTANSQLNSATSQNLTSQSSLGLSGGAVAAVVISILVILASLAGLFFFLKRRQRQARKDNDYNDKMGPGILSPPEPHQQYPFAAPTFEPPRTNAYMAEPDAGLRRTNSTSSYAQTAITFTTLGPSISMRDPNTSERSHYGAASEYTGSSVAPNDVSYPHRSSLFPCHSRTFLLRPQNRNSVGPSVVSSGSNSTSPRTRPDAQRRTTKGQLVLMPPTAGQLLEEVPEDELLANRLVVEGRAQDFGSVSSSTPVPSGFMAPPDYQQATEPYVPRAAS
ncbi:hypothetical protein HGRIS_002815 [Hohenbuehelia grisea]|uniref:Transmembrane protein n=1 Tax=Hohenbuehelia grisea TaxID=104357 RepID=A0ABR3JLK9_9AGAR